MFNPMMRELREMLYEFEEPFGVDLGEGRAVEITCDTSGTSGHHVFWLRADSTRAAKEGQPTSYIEIPLMVNVMH